MTSSLANIQEIFRLMEKEGFEMSNPLRWGFYFYDSHKGNLFAVFNELEEKNYSLADITQMDDGKWKLFVTKVETLTPEVLHRRNIAFNELADYCSVELYDGWDVEKL